MRSAPGSLNRRHIKFLHRFDADHDHRSVPIRLEGWRGLGRRSTGAAPEERGRLGSSLGSDRFAAGIQREPPHLRVSVLQQRTGRDTSGAEVHTDGLLTSRRLSQESDNNVMLVVICFVSHLARVLLLSEF